MSEEESNDSVQSESMQVCVMGINFSWSYFLQIQNLI